ncbi:hypothetical protein I4U23_001215 [Adineta vaga]|nr:hypothetical protein I4U23_001215 [Adineta vaga]
MSLLVDKLSVVEYPTRILSESVLLNNATTINNNDDDDRFICPVKQRYEPFEVVYGNVSSNAPIVIYFSQCQSTLRTKLIHYLKDIDITLIFFSIEDYLWQWLDLNPSITIASLILQSPVNCRELISRSHNYDSVQSILIRCLSTEILTIQRFVRSYARVDGIFDDDTRLLVKLFIDLTLFSEELGDQQREDGNNEFEAQRHYDRALKFCSLVKHL